LWQHSLVASHAAQIATNECLDFQADASISFTIGLLHDIGKLITSQFITPEVKMAMRLKVAHGYSPVEAERCMLGADHAEVGAALLYIWRLPEFIVEAVAMHHRPAIKPVARLSALASVANTLAHASDAAHCGQTPCYSAMDHEVFSKLGFPADRLNDVLSMIDHDCRMLEMAG
jgi:putative nucleotidyltransferase with HDIG domain